MEKRNKRKCEFNLSGGYGAVRSSFIYNYLESTDGEGLTQLIRTIGIGDSNLIDVCSLYFNQDKLVNLADYASISKANVLRKDCEDILGIDEDINNKRKIEILAEKLVRNKNYVELLKNYYDNTCQVCGMKLQMGFDGAYSEVHHIQPYNKSDDGDDKLENMIVLCPNCHKQFDRSYLAINPETLVVCYYEYGKIVEKTDKLVISEDLQLGDEYLEYAWQEFLSKYDIRT